MREELTELVVPETNLLTRYNAIVDERTQTVVYDDGEYDHILVRDENGQLVRKSIAATPEELRAIEVRNLHANLASVEERLTRVEEFGPEEHLLPTERAEKIEQRRQGLEAECAVIHQRLASYEEAERIEATADEPKRRRRR